MKYYLTGGQQKNSSSEEEYYMYGKAVVVEVDTETHASRIVIDYATPGVLNSEKSPSIIFKSGHLQKEILYICTRTEVMGFDIRTFNRVFYFTHPSLNDVHHVRASNRETVLVVNTGLDCLFEFNLEGDLLNEWNVMGENTWDRFDKTVDYRKVATTKPHKSHPNYCFLINDDIWVSRFHQRDAVCVTTPELDKFDISLQGIHDGVVYKDNVYFTTVNGFVFIFNKESKNIENKVNLKDFYSKKESESKELGWCRGILVENKDEIIVGFSRIRPTRWKENLTWIKHKAGVTEYKPSMPTRIVKFNIKTKTIIFDMDVEKMGLNAIFSIFKA